LICALSCVRPIEVELKCRVLNFDLNCLNSDVGLVRSVTLGCQSPIGKNFVSCQFFSLPAIVSDEHCALGYKQILVKARDLDSRYAQMSLLLTLFMFNYVMSHLC